MEVKPNHFYVDTAIETVNYSNFLGMSIDSMLTYNGHIKERLKNAYVKMFH